ncbi:MAG: hypothetical protein ACK5NC_08680 [Vibrio sp.]
MSNKYTEEQQQIINRTMRAVPEGIRESLNEEQIEAIERAIAVNNVRGDHYVDFRPTFGFFRWRYYAVFLLGKDRRKPGTRKSSISIMIKTVIFMVLAFFLFSLAVLSMYLIKSALGIDIFHNFSFGVWDYFKTNVFTW